nr:MAG TPA: hypothetical protein [Caudoviricetes sp.]
MCECSNFGLCRAAFLFNSSNCYTQMKTKFFSWQTIANLYNALPCEVCKCETIEDAKGYTKALLYLLSALFIAGLEKGGAL